MPRQILEAMTPHTDFAGMVLDRVGRLLLLSVSQRDKIEARRRPGP